MMSIALPVRKGQPVAAVLGRADGIGIIFVLSSFRMVSIHSVILRFDLNLENSNRGGGLRQPTLPRKRRRYSKTHLQGGKSRNVGAFNSYLQWSASSVYEPQYPDDENRFFLTVHRVDDSLCRRIKLVASDGQSCQTPSPTHKKSLQSKNSDLRDMGVFLDPVKTSFFYLAG